MHPSHAPIFVLEGPDGGGKSTLAHALEDLGWRYVHVGPPAGQPPYQQYLDLLADVARKRRTDIDVRPVVFDRLHLGERVYGPVLRDHDGLGPIHQRMLDRVLMGLSAVIVYCDPGEEAMTRVWAERAASGKELVKDRSLFAEIVKRYGAVLREQEVPWRRWSYLEAGADPLGQYFMDARGHENTGPGIGDWHPGGSTLLVGEQVNGSPGTLDWPFTGWAGSSRWLAEQLTSWGVPERNLYWVNAVTPSGEQLSPAFLADLQPRRVIALGKVAESWCLAHHGQEIISFSVVDHPQFWKRFHAKEPYPLRHLLVEEGA